MTKNKTWDDKKMGLTLINYGANVDFLGNFLSTEMVDFGGFIGFGIGGTTLAGEIIKNEKDVGKEDGYSVATTGFDIALNLGLRTNIAKYHGLEIVARVPFLSVKMVDEFDEIDSVSHKQNTWANL